MSLKAGVIGLRMGRAHMDAYRENPNTELYAICDINEELLRELKQKYDVPHASTDFRELVELAELDIVSVASPDFYHREQSVEALRNAKHVLCEKPLALSIEDCAEIVKAVRKTGKMFMVGQVCRFSPGFAMTKEIVQSGEIGGLFFVESEYAHDYRVAPGVGGWRRDASRPREPFIGGACHAVDLLRWIAGDPTEVTAYANHKCLVDWPVNDATIAIYKFENDVIGKVFCSIGCIRPYTMRSVFYGTKGTIISDNTSPAIRLCSQRYFKTKGEYDFARIPVRLSSHNVATEVAYFAEKILEGSRVEMNEIEGSKTVASCLGAAISAREGRTVRMEELFREFRVM